MQYVLKECRGSEHPLGPSKATDALIRAVGDWSLSDTEVVWVYDRYVRSADMALTDCPNRTLIFNFAG